MEETKGFAGKGACGPRSFW